MGSFYLFYQYYLLLYWHWNAEVDLLDLTNVEVLERSHYSICVIGLIPRMLLELICITFSGIVIVSSLVFCLMLVGLVVCFTGYYKKMKYRSYTAFWLHDRKFIPNLLLITKKTVEIHRDVFACHIKWWSLSVRLISIVYENVFWCCISQNFRLLNSIRDCFVHRELHRFRSL